MYPFLISVVLAPLSSVLTPALVVSVQKAESPKVGRHLVFDENFAKAKTINLKHWYFDDGPVYNNEKEKYTSAKGGNAYLKDGCLIIEARKTNGQITSARLESIQSWRYGYFEIEAKVPKGNGTWPAIWMLNDRLRSKTERLDWPKCGEIDIMENVGYDPAGFHFSLHSQNFNFQRKEQRTSVTNLAHPDAFHKFGLDWRAHSITFYVDGKVVYAVKVGDSSFDSWPYVDKYYLILNLAIGGFWGGAKGIDDAIFPARFAIRRVQIYQ